MVATPLQGTDTGSLIVTTLGSVFIFAEDEALKTLMQDIYVTDRRNANRHVKAYYGMPDMQITDQTYPYAVIDLINMREARERYVNGTMEYVTSQDGFPYIPGTRRSAMYPQPWDLDYSITTYARDPRHDRQIIVQMTGLKLPGRMGELLVPGDHSIRRAELLGFAKLNAPENQRKLYRNVFTIRVSTERELQTTREHSAPEVLTPVVDMRVVEIVSIDGIEQDATEEHSFPSP